MANGRRGGPRMGKAWDSIAATQLTMTADGVHMGSSGFAPGLGPMTVLRMIGEYTIQPTAAITALDACRVTVAIGVVSSDAFAAGVGSMPDPSSEPDYPWLYWADHPLYFAATDATVDPKNDTTSLRHRFDIRSMR